MATERVYAIWEFYDGIRTGVADFGGQPHYFEQEWSAQQQDYLPTFVLKPITPATLAEVLEQWQIFRSWEFTFHRGEAEANTHPGLPGQNARYAELEATIKAKLAESEGTQLARGLFSPLRMEGSLPKGVMRELQVEWQGEA